MGQNVDRIKPNMYMNKISEKSEAFSSLWIYEYEYIYDRSLFK